jgi:hypothetical protein
MKNNNATSCSNIQGHIRSTKDSYIRLGTINLTLDTETAYALCNILSKELIEEHMHLAECQKEPLVKLGEAISIFCDHPNQNIGDKKRK